jgi:hypothetical protein
VKMLAGSILVLAAAVLALGAIIATGGDLNQKAFAPMGLVAGGIVALGGAILILRGAMDDAPRER